MEIVIGNNVMDLADFLFGVLMLIFYLMLGVHGIILMWKGY